jgi:hypothetical protein
MSADGADSDEAREFARAYRSFLAWVHEEGNDVRRHEVVQLLRSHLGADSGRQSVVARDLPLFEHVNLQVALDAWSGERGRSVAVHGLALAPNYGGVSLHQLLHGEALPPLRLSAPDLVDLPSGPDRTIACLKSALLLVEDARGRYVVHVRPPERHSDEGLGVEVAGLATDVAQSVHRELDDLRSRLNVYRGQVLELVPGDMGFRLTFPVLPPTSREQVVLPEAVLRRVERHTISVRTHRDALRSAGQHLKRGLLLHGPPGTGKTHTTRYVVQQMEGCTVLMLSGMSLHMIGSVAALARELQPAVVVLEDVDLVARERAHGPGSNPVLFTLLDVMDGAAADADLLFLLTTNRADLLEPALAARPGRVDVAVEIGLPDAVGRRRLLDLYGHGVLRLTDQERDDVVDRTAGVTASFVKELVRRAVLESLEDPGRAEDTVTGRHVSRALDDLLDTSQAVTRALLGLTPSEPPGATPGDPTPTIAPPGA